MGNLLKKALACMQIALVAPQLPAEEISRILDDVRPFVDLEAYNLATTRAAVDIGIALTLQAKVLGLQGAAGESLSQVGQQA